MEDIKNARHNTVNIQKIYHRKILITGATGLIGSFLTDLLLYLNNTENAGIEIYVLARDRNRLEKRFASNYPQKNLHFITQDVVEPLKIETKVDYIIHAAGDGFPSAFREHPVETMTPALFGTYQLLQYAKECSVEKFLYVSSGEIYGRSTQPGSAFTEHDCGILDSMEVRSCYPAAKRCAETLCVSFQEQYQIPVIVTRLSHTYGTCTSVRDNRATTQFFRHALAGEPIILHSSGSQLRSYTYVSDCAAGILTVLLNGLNGEAYNIANRDSQVSIAEFAHILSEISGVSCMHKFPSDMEQRELSPIEYAVLADDKLRELGWQGCYDIHTGIRNMFMIGTECQIMF